MGRFIEERPFSRPRAISQEELNKLDHEAIGKYLRASEEGVDELYKPTQEEIRRHEAELTRTKFYRESHIFSFVNIETREKISFQYRDASDKLLSLIYKVYVTHQDVSMLDLYHIFLKIYPGSKTIVQHVMDATDLDIEQLDSGKRYPYLVAKLRMLFDPLKFVSYYELSAARKKLRDLLTFEQ